jgi:hypothetical protein
MKRKNHNDYDFSPCKPLLLAFPPLFIIKIYIQINKDDNLVSQQIEFRHTQVKRRGRSEEV